MATDTVPDDNAIYLQATEGVHKLKMRIDNLVEKNSRLEALNKEIEEDLHRAAIEKIEAFQENQDISHTCSYMESLLKETLEKNQVLENNVKGKHHSLKMELIDWKKRCSQMETKHQSLTNDVRKERKDQEDAIRKLKQIYQQNKAAEALLKQCQEAYRKLQTKTPDAKLSTDNANIVELSDEYRPTKIAEKFSELFDNEWTDAFEQVNEKLNNEERGVEFMLDILQFAFTLCNEISTTSIEKSSSTKCCTLAVSVGKEQTEMPSTFQHQDDIENKSGECNFGSGDSVPGQKVAGMKKREQGLVGGSVFYDSLVGGSESCDANRDSDSRQSLSGDCVPGRTRIETDEIVKSLKDEFIDKFINMKKDMGWKMTGRVQQELTSVICKRFEISTEKEDFLTKYIKKCIELCWYM